MKMEQKWEVKVSASIERARAEQIWPLFQDFFGLNKWFSSLHTCYGIQGTNGNPGCIRYCSGFSLKPQDNTRCGWSKESLTSIDPARMTLTYKIMDSNIGFNSYVSTITVVPRDKGCAVEWSISVDPVAGLELEDIVGKYQVGLELMVRKMEATIVGAS